MNPSATVSAKYCLLVALIYASITVCAIGYPNIANAQNTAHIGVLAYRGKSAAINRWLPLVEYLSSDIDGWNFELLPITLTSATRKIESQQIQVIM